MQTDTKLDNIAIRDGVSFEEDDMIAYVSVAGFLAMVVLLLLVLSV